MYNQATLFGYIDGKLEATDQAERYQIKFQPVNGSGENHGAMVDVTFQGLSTELHRFLCHHAPFLRFSCQLQSQPESQSVRLVTDIRSDMFLIYQKGRSYRPDHLDLTRLSFKRN